MAGQFAEDGRDADGNLVGWFKPAFQIRLAEILATELANTGNFTVVERERLYDVLQEQALTVTNPKTAAKKGNVTGAKYIVLASLSDFVPNVNRTRNSQDGRVLIFAFGNDRENVETYVAFDLRVIDTTTGEVAISRTIEGTSKSVAKADRFGMSFAFWGGGQSEKQSSETTPASRAVRAAMINIVEYLNCSLYLKDSCMDTYKAMDEKRKQNTKGTLNLF
jgi:curli biogenesis system outer membrane secretion channel CsgG